MNWKGMVALWLTKIMQVHIYNKLHMYNVMMHQVGLNVMLHNGMHE